nr:hypothetical protein [Bacteroidota bacterium]
MNTFNYSEFILQEKYFNHLSHRHGINHTYRVMYHVLNIGRNKGLIHETKVALCAAFIHDMSRLHDGFCSIHGLNSAKEKLPLFQTMFLNYGLTKKDLKTIELAVTNHSLPEEVQKDHPAYKTVALLKDADALDRIRICEKNLNPSFLRYTVSHSFIGFAKKLYRQTDHLKIVSFDEIIAIAGKID